ncbi:MAG: tetratricopeptide repeat protein [Planctomycetota bacterium]|jgi:tetratricopeptide (TPR) repeat protein
MPYTLNGIGTHYYGKKNLQQRPGTCAHCNKSVILSSYDTTNYFVVFFVPLIPLGKKRILEQCPACTTHKAISLKEWLTEKEHSVNEAIDAYQANPGSSENAKKGVETFLAYQEIQSFLEIAPILIQDFADCPEIMNLVGSTYVYFGYHAEAEQAYIASLAAKNDPEIHESLAFCLIGQIRPDEAIDHLQHIIDNRIDEKADYLITLAESYQAQGRHLEALDILEKAADVFPFLKTDKTYKKALKISRKYMHINKPVKSQALDISKMPKASAHDFNAKKIWLIASCILLVILAVFLVTAYQQGKSRNVYFVNGLSRPYSVSVNGISHVLIPLRANQVRTGEGSVVVKVLDDKLDIPQKTYGINTSFFARPFKNKTFIVNPDSVAPIVWEKVYYVLDEADAPIDEQVLNTGKDFYVFEDIDFPFTALPPTASISYGRKIAKNRICFLLDLGVEQEDIPGIISEEMGSEAVVSYIENHLLYEPEIDRYLFLLYAIEEKAEFVETIQPGLLKRPVLTEWHRMYQQAKEISEPEYDLEAEYRKYLDAEPENSTLQYLLGRAMNNTEDALPFLEKSIQGPDPCPYGFYSLGYQKMSIGQFDEAAKLFYKAFTQKPESLYFNQMYRQALMAAGRYDEAAAQLNTERMKKPLDFTLAEEEIYLWAVKGDREKAQKVFQDWCKNADESYSPEILDELSNIIATEIAYLSGDLNEYQEKTINYSDSNDILVRDLNLGKTIDISLVEQINISDPYIYLLLYISEQRAGRKELAEKYLSNGAEMLYGQGRRARIVADCIRGQKQPVPGEMYCLPFDVSEKAVWLSALGFIYPEHRKDYFELAEKLNCNRRFPHLFLKSVLEETGENE